MTTSTANGEHTEGRQEIIRIRDLSFSYDEKPFLDNIHLTIYADDFLGIIGPNGGGKTTLLKLILGMLRPDSGTIEVFGRAPREGRTDIGYLSQFVDIDFDFPITANEVVQLSRLGGRLIGRYSRDDKQAAEYALRQMQIWELRDRKLNELSGGEKQRVFVARALANRPRLLLLDEPMSNIDIHVQEAFYEILNELHRDIAIVVVDHNLDMLSRFVKEVACINKCDSYGLRYHGVDSLEMKRMCEV
ncbi:MAG: ABC transporter ATP-binding protein [Candidatus Aminicenantaceae bacterium]